MTGSVWGGSANRLVRPVSRLGLSTVGFGFGKGCSPMVFAGPGHLQVEEEWMTDPSCKAVEWYEFGPTLVSKTVAVVPEQCG